VLAPMLGRVLGPRVVIVDSAATTAAALAGVLDAHDLRRPQGIGPGTL